MHVPCPARDDSITRHALKRSSARVVCLSRDPSQLTCQAHLLMQQSLGGSEGISKSIVSMSCRAGVRKKRGAAKIDFTGLLRVWVEPRCRTLARFGCELQCTLPSGAHPPLCTSSHLSPPGPLLAAARHAAPVQTEKRALYQTGFCIWGGKRIIDPGGRTLLSPPRLRHGVTLAMLPIPSSRSKVAASTTPGPRPRACGKVGQESHLITDWPTP